MNAASRLVRDWYRTRLTPLTLLLTPLSALFALVASIRRTLYATGICKPRRLRVPVVVVGNITVGGSGKTPLAAALASDLAARGFHPGIVSRGYARDERAGDAPLLVAANDDARHVGDEPLLLARSGFSVAVARDRVAAALALLAAHPECDVIIADDGLQHYRLARDIEIAVVDGERGAGNGWRLPAGPLRESVRRLREVDVVVTLVQDDGAGTHDSLAAQLATGRTRSFRMRLIAQRFRRVGAPDITADTQAFVQAGVHAVAGIANPQRFFAQLKAMGIDAVTHSFPDHHAFVPADLAFTDAAAILMTEKDAVKCESFANARCWYLPVRAALEPPLGAHVEEKLRGCKTA